MACWKPSRRSGNYIRQPDTPTSPVALTLPPPLDTGVYVGIHGACQRCSKPSQQATIKVNLASAYCAPALYPLKVLQDNMLKALRGISTCTTPRARLAATMRCATSLPAGMTAKTHLTADRIVITHGATEAI